MPEVTSSSLGIKTLLVLHGPQGPVQATMDCCQKLAKCVLAAQESGAGGPGLLGCTPEAVVIDACVSHERALEIIGWFRAVGSAPPILVLSARPSLDWAVRLVRAGAHDYLSSPLEEHSLRQILAQASALRACEAPAGGDEERYFSDCCPPGLPIVGRSTAMQKALATIKLVASSACNPVLIVGETGTGKELAARAVHAWRCGDPDRFIGVNCAALTANLLESELFGHVKGAFTGADRDKVGLMELAGEGSIFLDEITEMAPELQAKLLRVLQEKTFRRVGGTRDIRCQATIIASSNRDLLAEVRTGRIRKDLYYRLAVFPIHLPPLRDPHRRSDILLLADYFVRHSNIPARAGVTSISRPAQMELTNHSWPGNVRELRNVIDRAMILETTREITPYSLLIDRDEPPPAAALAMLPHPLGLDPRSAPALPPGPFAAPSAPPPGFPQAPAPGQPALPPAPPAAAPAQADFSLEAAEREFILRALRETNWQRTRAAALLGITRATLLAKLKRYDLKVPSANAPAGETRQTWADPAPRD